MRNRWLVRGGSLLAATLVFALSVDLRAQTFTDATILEGIYYTSVPQSPSPILEQLTAGGAAAGDFNNDGWQDLYITRYFARDLLYRNYGNGPSPCNFQFCDVTQTAFSASWPSLPISTNGAVWGDIDNDYDLDLYVTSIAEQQHYLYVNDGAGNFTEQAALRGADLNLPDRLTYGNSASMGDYDNDGYLDIYVTEWRDPQEISIPAQSRLFRNQGASNPGYFVDVTETAGVAMDLLSGGAAARSLAYAPRFSDLDGDGYLDLAVVSDLETSRLFWNNGDGTFSDGTTAAGIASGFNDMGIDIADINRDGLLDLFVTDIEGVSDGYGLFLNNGDRTFTDVAVEAGVNTGGGWGWGTDTLDYDNDGDLDITMTNGNPNFGGADFQDVLWRNDGNTTVMDVGVPVPTFTNVSNAAGINNVSQGRGLMTFDYDNDGDMDIFVVSHHDPPVLYRNNGGTGNHYLRVKTVGTVSNADGIGAVITVTPDLSDPEEFQTWEVSASSNFQSTSEQIAHFGLGSWSDPVGQVTVHWPASGLTNTFFNVGVDKLLTVVEPIDGLGDYDLSGVVNLGDYILFRDTMGMLVAPGSGADGNRNGHIDDGDYQVWLYSYGNWSEGAAAGAAAGGAHLGVSVPEPAAWKLVAILAAMAAGLPRRRSGAFSGRDGWPRRPAG